MVETPVSGEMVLRFSNMGRKGRWPLEVASQGKKVSWGNGVTAKCRLAEISTVDGAVVASGIGVGAVVDLGMAVGAVVDPGMTVGAGAVVEAGAGVAVADELQATINTSRMEARTAGFLSGAGS